MTQRMGPQTSGQARPSAQATLPPDLASVALIDAKTAAAVGGLSLSWWHERVASGDAPPPAIRQARCTRWRLADVARFWREFAGRNTDDGSVMQRAAKASAKAQAKRQAAQAGA